MDSETEKIKKIILLLLNRLNENITRTKIVKLLFLLDYVNYVNNGKKITNISYDYYYYGPYSRKIIDVIDDMKNENLLSESEHFNSNGNVYYIYSTNSETQNPEQLLDSDETNTFEEVVKKYGHLSLKQLLEYVYSTPPIRDNRQGTESIL